MLQLYYNKFSTATNYFIFSFWRFVPDIFCCSLFYMFQTGIIHMRAIMQQLHHKIARIVKKPDLSTLRFCLSQSLLLTGVTKNFLFLYIGWINYRQLLFYRQGFFNQISEKVCYMPVG